MCPRRRVGRETSGRARAPRRTSRVAQPVDHATVVDGAAGARLDRARERGSTERIAMKDCGPEPLDAEGGGRRPSNDAEATCDSCSVTRTDSIAPAPGPRSPRPIAASMRSKTTRARNSVVVFRPAERRLLVEIPEIEAAEHGLERVGRRRCRPRCRRRRARGGGTRRRRRRWRRAGAVPARTRRRGSCERS